MSEIVRDIELFYKTIGALKKLAEIGLRELKKINSLDHALYLFKLCEKYGIEVELTANLADDILNMEYIIHENFTEIMENNIKII